MERMNSKKAFTLIEILIVVAILGILAAIVIPQFSHSSTIAKEAAAKETLQTLRTQIELYTVQHNGRSPGYIGNELQAGFVAMNQLVYCSNLNGIVLVRKIPAGEYKYGPYLLVNNFNIVNPFNDKYLFEIVTEMPATPDGTNGWLYNPETKEIRINWPGTDSEGQPYYSY